MMMIMMTTKIKTVTTEIITTMMGKKIIFSNLVYLIVSYSLVMSVGISFRIGTLVTFVGKKFGNLVTSVGKHFRIIFAKSTPATIVGKKLGHLSQVWERNSEILSQVWESISKAFSPKVHLLPLWERNWNTCYKCGKEIRKSCHKCGKAFLKKFPKKVHMPSLWERN